jgi:hypothetical protein
MKRTTFLLLIVAVFTATAYAAEEGNPADITQYGRVRCGTFIKFLDSADRDKLAALEAPLEWTFGFMSAKLGAEVPTPLSMDWVRKGVSVYCRAHPDSPVLEAAIALTKLHIGAPSPGPASTGQPHADEK